MGKTTSPRQGDRGQHARAGQPRGQPHRGDEAADEIRELAAVFGVAALSLVFAGHGGYASHADFVRGFVPAIWLAAALAGAGVLAAFALPRGTARARGLTDPAPGCENDARGAVSAGAAG